MIRMKAQSFQDFKMFLYYGWGGRWVLIFHFLKISVKFPNVWKRVKIKVITYSYDEKTLDFLARNHCLIYPINC